MISLEDENFAKSLVDLSLDRSFYKGQFKERQLPADLVEHYINEGWREGFDPAPWFSTRSYLSVRPELLEQGLNPLVHYLLRSDESDLSVEPSAAKESVSSEAGRGAGVAAEAVDVFAPFRADFDAVWYVNQIGNDRALEISDLLAHYMAQGWRDGLDPNAWFSTTGYLAAHPDVAAHDINPFWHYIVAGRKEGRGVKATEDKVLEAESENCGEAASDEAEDFRYMRQIVATEFNRDFYLAKYTDIAESGIDPLTHFLIQGWRENRDPNPFFSVQFYASHSPDVISAGVNPFYHYLVTGRKEGRKGRHEQGFRFDVLKNLKSVDEQVADALGWAPSVNPMRGVDLQDRMAAFLSGDKRLIVSFSHDQFTKHVGGVQLCIRRELKQFLEMGLAHLHLFPAASQPVSARESNPVLGILLDGELAGFAKADVLVRTVKTCIAKVRNRPLFVIHSLLGHNIKATIDLLRAFRVVEGYFWLHDYAAACTNFKLMRNDVQYCGAPPATSLACYICEYGPTRMLQANAYAELFSTFKTHLLSPSQAALDVIDRGGSLKLASRRVLPHCSLAPVTTPAAKRASHDRLRVGFLGYPADHKGWPVFRELAVRYGDDPRYEFHHLGQGEPVGLPIIYHEVVASDDKLDLMAKAVADLELDVALLWALWPETFCLVAYEAVAGGAMLVTGRDSGNVEHMVRSGNFGEVVSSETALAAAFESGEILKMARKNRKVQHYEMTFSSLTATALLEV